MARLQINEKKKLGRIEPEVYGHFSEHLGRCIYEGLYVGEESDIENVNGMRTDVVEALRELQVPVLRWPGGCFADEICASSSAAKHMSTAISAAALCRR